jgi:Putative protein-S-isoprenylcysteine methyltransferase
MVRHAHYRTGDRDGSRRCSGRCHLVVRCCESFPVGQIEDPERTWAYSRTAWSLSFRPASVYASRIVLIIGVALTLGSWIALVPAVLIALLLVLRTSLEDRMLTTELPGYREYAKHVPERLVPGLW